MTRNQISNIEKLEKVLNKYQDDFLRNPTWENKQQIIVAKAILDNYKKAI